MDSSLEPAILRASGTPGCVPAADLWAATLAGLDEAPHVCVLWYSCTPFVAAVKHGGHVELLGTFARFLPLFDTPLDTPAWVGSPPTGSIVCTSDIDFGDYPTEHLMLHVRATRVEIRVWGTSGPQAAT